DHPNIHLMVEEIQYPAKTLYDLEWVLAIDGEKPSQKFMVFSDSRKETERIVTYLQSRYPAHQQNKIVWFHSGMSAQFRQKTMDRLQKGEIWGICCTDTAGMASFSY
ncbi:hypothetical protein SERLA73DRAFT_43684, partial [Serpula lacrymans var. lacrymans S7.3]